MRKGRGMYLVVSVLAAVLALAVVLFPQVGHAFRGQQIGLRRAVHGQLTLSNPFATWTIVPDATVGRGAGSDSGVGGIAAISATDILAVGYQVLPHTVYAATLVEQWNNSTWVLMPSPSVANVDNYLDAVSADSAHDAWAVGYTGNSSTLALHWTGTTWNIVPTPNNINARDQLSAVVANSPTDVWAVGQSNSLSSGNTTTLIEHWDGASWSIVPSPNFTNSQESVLTGVIAISVTDMWAVGYGINTVGYEQPITEHWDGVSWSFLPAPSSGPNEEFDRLNSVAARSASDVWAVGYASPGGPQTKHWNGAAWTNVPDPTPGGGELDGVAVAPLSSTTSTPTVWAVGETSVPQSYYPVTLTQQWTGSRWVTVPSPSGEVGTQRSGLVGVAVLSPTDVWAGGVIGPGQVITFQALIEHYHLSGMG